MNYLLTFTAGLLYLTYGVRTERTTCISINNVAYEKELLKGDLVLPYKLSVDFSTNTLFYMVGRFGDFTADYIELGTKRHGKISGMPEGRATAVDNTKHVVYLGAGDGIYKYNYNNHEAENLNITKDRVYHMFFKHNLYYTIDTELKAYVIKDGIKSTIPELSTPESTEVSILGLDEHDNTYFYNDYGLFVYRKDSKSIKDVGRYVVNGFAADKDGYLYFSTYDKIFKINNNNIEEIFSDTHIYGFAIDGDNNIIYATPKKIYRLKRTNKQC